jgi:hypothetical protein
MVKGDSARCLLPWGISCARLRLGALPVPVDGDTAPGRWLRHSHASRNTMLSDSQTLALGHFRGNLFVQCALCDVGLAALGDQRGQRGQRLEMGDLGSKIHGIMVACWTFTRDGWSAAHEYSRERGMSEM